MPFNARETVYRGTRMRSRLEARFAQMCDRLMWRCQYEPLCFAGINGQYLPDFYVETPLTKSWVEVKPTISLAYAAARRMEVILETDQVTRLVVATPASELMAGAAEGLFLATMTYESDGEGGRQWFSAPDMSDGRWDDKHWGRYLW